MTRNNNIMTLVFSVTVSLPGALGAQPHALSQLLHGGFIDRAATESASQVPAAVKPDLASGLAQTIAQIIADPTQDITLQEKMVISYFGKAYEAGQLEKTVIKVLDAPEIQHLLPPPVLANKGAAVRQLTAYIGAELETAGVVPGVSGAESWVDMSARHLKLALASAYRSRKPGETSLFSELGFVNEFAVLTGAPFTRGNEVRFLVDGPASFSERERLIKNAKKSIHILTWALYDDETGKWTIEQLTAKKRENPAIDIKIMVDGKTSGLHGKNTIATLSQTGIEVVRFQDDSRQYDGLHCKSMVVDGEAAIAGGMNFGNVYSHMGIGQKWRDTDVLVTGPAVAQFSDLFADLWNKQAGAKRMPRAARSANAGNSMVSVIAQTPGKESYVMLGILKAISGASTRINIENAYVIMMPALKMALMDALSRGVQVNILTNSATSVDEPVVSVPILKSLPDLLKAGAGIYLKNGDTLHSKFLTVDGVFCQVGSFNMHPRSIRYEKEMAVNIVDPQMAAELEAIFNTDVSRARKITTPEQLNIPASTQSDLIQRYFFNQL